MRNKSILLFMLWALPEQYNLPMNVIFTAKHSLINDKFSNFAICHALVLAGQGMYVD